MFRTSNPVFNSQSFRSGALDSAGETMSVGGTITKTLLLITLTVISAIFSAGYVMQSQTIPYGMMIGSSLIALVLSFIIVFNPRYAPVLSPIYAVTKGVALGIISLYFASAYSGIVVQAFVLTLLVFAIMLLTYRLGLIKVTRRFRSIIIGATMAVAFFYVGMFILSMFGVNPGLFHSSSPLAIAINIGIAGLAAFNLLLDFDFIERGSQNGLPKQVEWLAAFGLLVTLVWLYIELLRLLSRISRR